MGIGEHKYAMMAEIGEMVAVPELGKAIGIDVFPNDAELEILQRILDEHIPCGAAWWDAFKVGDDPRAQMVLRVMSEPPIDMALTFEPTDATWPEIAADVAAFDIRVYEDVMREDPPLFTLDVRAPITDTRGVIDAIRTHFANP